MTRPPRPRGRVRAALVPQLWFLLLLALGGFGCRGETPRDATTGGSAQPPNILFLNLEDTSAAALGCYGSELARTPNLDAFAQSGVRFERAYCQFPACYPSRASYFTGLRPRTSGVLRNRARPRRPLAPTWLEALAERGYARYAAGKLLHFQVHQARVFDQTLMTSTGDPRLATYFAKGKPIDWFGPSEVPAREHPDQLIGDTAVAMLQQLAQQRQPFVLAVGFFRPHAPLDPPADWFARFADAPVPLPDGWDETRPDFNPDLFTDRWPTADEARTAIRAYHACLAFVDHQVGRVLRALEETGLAERTVVIATADHGFHLGDHGRWSKYTPYEPSTRVPLIVRVPGHPQNGATCDRIVELIDLAPTVRALAGCPPSPSDEGDSLLPLLAEPARTWKQAAFTFAGAFGARGPWVRTERFRYGEAKTRSGHTLRWLFDLDEDPGETRNLVAEPEYAAVVEEHARILKGGWRGARPPR